MEQFKKIPLRERIGKVGYLLKHTFTVVGRDFDILNPIVRMAVYGVVQATLFMIGLMLLIYAVAADASGLWSWGWLGVIVGLVLFIYKFFYYNRQEFRQSYLVSQTVTGADKGYSDAVADCRELNASIRGMAFIDMAMAYVNKIRRNRENKGLLAGLVSMILAGLNEVWDLANHFLIPAVVVDRIRLRDGVERMKSLQGQVPETLVGVFGIDLFGRVVGALMAPVYLVATLLALWLSFSLAPALPSVTVPLDNPDLPGWMMHEGAMVLTLIPLFVILLIAKLLSVVLERLVTAVKIMYFTIFYMQITHPDRIAPDLREELTAYLRMQHDGDGQQTGES